MSTVQSAVGRAFADHFGADPSAVYSAPGRVNLIGGHTDYNDGFVLPVAVDRRTAVAGRARDDGTLCVRSADFEETFETGLDDLHTVEEPAWANYVQGVAAELVAEGCDLAGADLLVSGNVPMGAGLASSAALELAAAATLADLAGADVDTATLAEVAHRAETEFVGVSCGIMDQYASAFAKRHHALFLDCRSREVQQIPLDAGRMRLVVTDTCVEHSLVDSAYNDRVEQCGEAVAHFADALAHEVAALRDVSREEFEAHADGLPDVIRRRARHVVTENDRVHEAREALRRDDFAVVGDLMSASHESLRDDYEVSCEELDHVVDIAADLNGVHGSRMTGAGFGGCVVSLVEPGPARTVAEEIRREYVERTDILPKTHVFEAAPGLAGGAR